MSTCPPEIALLPFQPLEVLAHSVDPLPPLGRQVGLLAGVEAQVEELRLAPEDQLVAAPHQSAQRVPAHRVEGEEALEVQASLRVLRGSSRAVDQWAPHRAQRILRQGSQRQERRRYVSQGDRMRDARSAPGLYG